jgi:hypothetical protein
MKFRHSTTVSYTSGFLLPEQLQSSPFDQRWSEEIDFPFFAITIKILFTGYLPAFVIF